MIGVDEIKKLWPLAEMDGLVGALWHPTDGHIAPVDVTMALAKGARVRGAEMGFFGVSCRCICCGRCWPAAPIWNDRLPHARQHRPQASGA